MQARTTPRKSRRNRFGSGSSSGSSTGSQKYTAYLKERPSVSSSVDSTEENPFSRAEEIYGQLRLANSQPTINNSPDDDNNPNDLTNQLDPSPTDRGIGDIQPQQQQQQNNNNNLLKGGFDFLIGLLGIPIFFIKNLIDFVWNSLNVPNIPSNPSANATSSTIINDNRSSTTNNKNNKWLIYLLLFAIILLLLLLFLKFGDDDKTLADYFPSNAKVRFWSLDGSTYRIQPIEDHVSNGNKNDSIILTLDDLRKVIIAEVRNHLKSEDEKRLPPSADEPIERLRDIISEEVKQITAECKNMVSSEVKKGLTHIRTDATRWKKGKKGEEMLEIIRREAHQVVKNELLVFSQDKINRPDFALYTSGAKVIYKYTSKTYERWPDKWYRKTLAYLLRQGVVRGKPPVTAITPDTHVGQCWPFPGHDGQLAVWLNRRVIVTAVTYDHVSRDVAVEVASAPKEFEVWGLVDDGTVGKESNIDTDELDLDDTYEDMESTEEACGVIPEDGQFISGKNYKHGSSLNNDGLSRLDPSLDSLTSGELGSHPLHLFLGNFTYNISDLPVQTFEVPQEILNLRKPVRAIIMKVTSNWGKPEYTCLYRFRVHGEPADKQI